MIRFFLGLAALAVLWFVAGNSVAQPQPPKAGKANAPAGWPHEVKGYGKTVEDARHHAVLQAVERVTGFLDVQKLEAWKPDEEYIRKHVLDGDGQPGADIKLEGVDVKVWVQPLKDPNWNEMVQLNTVAQRHQVSAERQGMAGAGLAALSALLLTGWGYFRLDELTKGRMSKWLSIGAAAILLLTGGLWLLSVL
jgi:hypothetical protein